MRSREVLDLEGLLAPLGEERPTGIDLREDPSPQSIYYRLKDARAAARAAERQAEAEGIDPGLLPEWRTIATLAVDALAHQSKDLEIACWLVEAAVRSDGFAGLNSGLALLNGLVERYWGGLHSLQDEDGMSTFVAPLSGLNGIDGEGILIPPIRKVPLTAEGEAGPFAAYHFDRALALQQITDKATRQKRLDAGVATLEVVERTLMASPKPFLRALLIDLKGCLEELGALSLALNDKCGAAAPPTSNIRNALEGVLELVESRTRSLIPPETLTEAPAAPAAEEPAAQADQPAAPARPDILVNREDALRQLSKIADFFRQTEPHSPISLSLDDLVRRARLTLPELLAELLPDAAARRTLLTNAGIRPPPDS